MAKRDKELREMFLAIGWELARQRKHLIWRCPCGEHTIVTAATMSDHRALKNVRAMIRRSGCASASTQR